MFWILGLNKRNLNYIKKRNPRKNIRLANNKYKTKKFLEERGIPVPQTYDLIADRPTLFDYDFSHLPTRFVIKPNHGSKGNWILLVTKLDKEESIEAQKNEKKKEWTLLSRGEKWKQWIDRLLYSQVKWFGQYLRIKKEAVSDRDLKKILVGTIDGQHTLWGKPDQILIEEILTPGEQFAKFCEFWLADIRVITFNLVSIAAELRMPTLKSGGKANLAQWGIGFWVNICTGKITTVKYEDTIYTDEFPEELKHFQNTTIPYWDDILLYSSNIQYFANIWFLWIDRVITQDGPKLLEINARAGLEIQNIAQQPLEKVMKKIADLKINTPGKWIEITKTLFSKKKNSITPTSKTIYLSQQWQLTYTDSKENQEIEDVIITTDTNNKLNYMSPLLANKLKESTTVSLKFPNGLTIKEPRLRKSDNLHGEHISLWRNTLQKFYIKPIHKAKVQTDIFAKSAIIDEELDLLQILDQKLHNISKGISLSKFLKPTNYLDEFDKYITKRGKYNPQFIYDFPDSKQIIGRETALKRLWDEHHEWTLLHSPFATLFYAKIQEVENKVWLIKSFKAQDFDKTQYYNEKLYWKINKELLALSQKKIQEWEQPSNTQLWKRIGTHESIIRLKEYLKKNDISGVKIQQDPSLISRISVSVWSKPKIKLLTRATFRETEFKAILAHEVDTHLTRFVNGQKTWWHILRTWTAGYLATEEGLAIQAADTVYQKTIPAFDSIGKYKNYLLVSQSGSMSFRELADYLQDLPYYWWQRSRATTFQTLTKLKRGVMDTSKAAWSYYKNKIYLDWFTMIGEKYDNNTEIMIGKISLENLALFKKNED